MDSFVVFGRIFQMGLIFSFLHRRLLSMSSIFITSDEIHKTFVQEKFMFSSVHVLDDTNKTLAAELVTNADVLIAMGGHVPTQNKFFAQIHLRELLEGFTGLYIGSSAGSMNASEIVYAQPEKVGEAVDSNYEKFIPGLYITPTILIPHFNQWKEEVLDGLNLLSEITIPDSAGKTFVLLNDGSYIYGDTEEKNESIIGGHYYIRNSMLE